MINSFPFIFRTSDQQFAKKNHLNLARTTKEKAPPPPTTTPKKYIQEWHHVECRETLTQPQETPMEMAAKKTPRSVATQEVPVAVAPKEPVELATQGLPQRMATSKTRNHMGSRNSRRKAVTRRNQRTLELDLIVTKVNLTKDQLSFLHKGRSFVPGPQRKKCKWRLSPLP